MDPHVGVYNNSLMGNETMLLRRDCFEVLKVVMKDVKKDLK
jgi:hypothetical protein